MSHKFINFPPTKLLIWYLPWFLPGLGIRSSTSSPIPFPKSQRKKKITQPLYWKGDMWFLFVTFLALVHNLFGVLGNRKGLILIFQKVALSSLLFLSFYTVRVKSLKYVAFIVHKILYIIGHPTAYLVATFIFLISWMLEA